jgi:hypothetical protein
MLEISWGSLFVLVESFFLSLELSPNLHDNIPRGQRILFFIQLHNLWFIYRPPPQDEGLLSLECFEDRWLYRSR